MATVSIFNDNMIESYFKSKETEFLKDSAGDYCVRLGRDDDWGCGLDIWLIKGGKNKGILTVAVYADKEIAKQNWGKYIMLCNTYNKERRWPKAYLQIDDENTSTNGKLILEEHIDLEKGIHQELFNDYVDTVLSAAFGFWKWLHKEKGL